MNIMELEGPGTVYQICGKKPDEVYVGSTRTDLNVRRAFHFGAALARNRNGKMNMGKLYVLMRQINDQGIPLSSYFTIKALASLPNCSNQQLLALEQMKINELNTIEKGLNVRSAFATIRKEEQRRRKQERDLAEGKWTCHLCMWGDKPAAFKEERTKKAHYEYFHRPTFFDIDLQNRVSVGPCERRQEATQRALAKDKEFTEKRTAEMAALVPPELIVLDPAKAGSRARMSEARDRAAGLTTCKTCGKVLQTKRGLKIHTTKAHGAGEGADQSLF